MKVIFLDIDGVLNSTDWYKRRPSRNLKLDPVAVARLSSLLSRTDAMVVVSSTWRLLTTIPRLVSMLTAVGLAEEHAVRFVGCTPVFPNRYRGREIASWLNMVPGVTSFVILDDDSDMEPHKARLVQTSHDTGLLDSHVERVVEMLGGGW